MDAKHVVITGGSDGIGLETACKFSADGADISIVARDATKMTLAKKKIEAAGHSFGKEVQCIQCDLSDQMQRNTLRPLLKDVDVLVNNAGAIPAGSLNDLDEVDWKRAWDLKVFGYIDLCRQTLPHMIEKKTGVIINIIGMAGENPSYNYLCGSMANASLIAMTRALGVYVGYLGQTNGSKVRVVGINPGFTETSRIHELIRARTETEDGTVGLDDFPYGRMARSEEVADLAFFLGSDMASYINGTTVNIDGGRLVA